MTPCKPATFEKIVEFGAPENLVAEAKTLSYCKPGAGRTSLVYDRFRNNIPWIEHLHSDSTVAVHRINERINQIYAKSVDMDGYFATIAKTNKLPLVYLT